MTRLIIVHYTVPASTNAVTEIFANGENGEFGPIYSSTVQYDSYSMYVARAVHI